MNPSEMLSKNTELVTGFEPPTSDKMGQSPVADSSPTPRLVFADQKDPPAPLNKIDSGAALTEAGGTPTPAPKRKGRKPKNHALNNSKWRKCLYVRRGAHQRGGLLARNKRCEQLPSSRDSTY